LAVDSVFSKYYIPNTIIAHEQWMGDFHLKAIEDTENVIITTFLAVVAIFVISTPLLPFKMTYAASISGPISIAQAKVVYNNHKYDMSPFILPRVDT
jgi:hypothetical protein